LHRTIDLFAPRRSLIPSSFRLLYFFQPLYLLLEFPLGFLVPICVLFHVRIPLEYVFVFRYRLRIIYHQRAFPDLSIWPSSFQSLNHVQISILQPALTQLLFQLTFTLGNHTFLTEHQLLL